MKKLKLNPNSKKLRRTGLVLFGLPLLILLAFYLTFPRLIRCYMIQFAGYERYEERIYISQQMPQVLIDPLLRLKEEASQRVRDFWGEMQSEPYFIFCSTEEEFQFYGNNLGTPAMVNITPFRSYVIVKPDGANVDVLSHEICHAEFTHRLGWYRKKKQIPAWFDEGLALMLDYRYPGNGAHDYQAYQKKWESYTLGGKKAIPLEELRQVRDFFRGDRYWTYLAYLSSGREVSHWLELVGKPGLMKMIQAVKAGENFETVYQELKEKNSRQTSTY